MSRFATVSLTGTDPVQLTAVVAPMARPANSRMGLEIFVSGTFTNVQISAKPNRDVATPINITGAILTANGSMMIEISADEFYATRTGGTGATVYYRLVG
jgi:hypothetical protein